MVREVKANVAKGNAREGDDPGAPAPSRAPAREARLKVKDTQENGERKRPYTTRERQFSQS